MENIMLFQVSLGHDKTTNESTITVSFNHDIEAIVGDANSLMTDSEKETFIGIVNNIVKRVQENC